MARVRGEIEELVGPPEDDLDLLHRAPLPHQPVVDPRSDDPPAELRQGELQNGSAAERRRALVEERRGERQVLDGGERERRTRAQVDLGGGADEALRDRLARGARDRGARRDLVLDHRGRRVAPEPNDRPPDQGAFRRAGCPAQQDRAFDLHAVRDVEVDALAPEAAREGGELLVRRERRRDERVADPRCVPGDGRAERLEGHAARDEVGLQRQPDDDVVPQLDDARRTLRQRRIRSGGRRVRAPQERPCAEEVGGAEVDVQRVELVRFDREPDVVRRRRGAILAKPRGLAALRAQSDRSRRRLAVGRGPAAGGSLRPRLGGNRHPSDPSISIFTRRLNSMAYSIGSSLVKISRKPWTTRFVASFSVRPRLIR